MAVTIDDIEVAIITRAQPILGTAFRFFKEQMDSFPAGAETFTIIFERGDSSLRSPNDELRFTMVVEGKNYSVGKVGAMNIYRAFHGLWDVMSVIGGSEGQCGFFLCDPPYRYSDPNQILTVSNIWIIGCRTWAETRS